MSNVNAYRGLPSVDRLLAEERVQALALELSSAAVVDLVREELAAAREAVGRGAEAPAIDTLVRGVELRAAGSSRATLRPVINATGVVLHTNLGRAPLSDEAIEAMAAVTRGYSNLEFDVDGGERGSRYVHLEEQVRRLTGAEAAMAVNNNASAVLLTLSALCAGREVVISRGQLIEIGGGFRIPDVMAQSGAVLREVGTTNRTYLRDYAAAMGDETAALMHAHASNFKTVGFTAEVSLEELASVAKERGVLLLDDLGSGCLLDTREFGLPLEPRPQDSIAAGADVAMFSGDKLLGGPQAGIIAGRRQLIERLRRHPLARAMRLDKATIAALAATLGHYLKGEALEKIPIWRMISIDRASLRRRARRWARSISGASVIDGMSMIGGGSLPEEGLATALLAVGPEAGASAETITRRLRAFDPPVIARIERDRVLLDPRTVPPHDDTTVLRALQAALAG
jgi:L-seryl-tRNA(Ser) seleniumtransferase